MGDNFYKRLVMLTASGVILICAVLLANTVYAADNSGIVQIQMSDVREIVTYTTALEAENAQYKKSLESERAAVSEMLDEFKQERQAREEYEHTLEEQYNQQIKTVTKLQRRNKLKDYILAALAATVITLAVTH